MSKIILMYCPFIEGHKLEYIHHLYEGARINSKYNYVFIVPQIFKRKSSTLEWQSSLNISFEYLEDTDKIYCTKGLLLSFYLSKRLNAYIRKYNADKVFLIDLFPYFPFLSICRKAKIRGIMYKIYPYGWKKLSWYKKLIEIIRHLLFIQSNNIEYVYVLNDELGAYLLNKKYRTNKYRYIPDPISTKGKVDKSFDLREEYNIPSNKIIFLHAGGMLRYKGTLQILNAIRTMSPQIRDKFCFIFAGRVTDEIKAEFENLFLLINDTNLTKRIEGFLSYERMNALFNQSDYVLIPYYPRIQSSGIISYGALFNKPVITTKQGVVGKLVKRYELGILLEDNSPNVILNALEQITHPRTIDGSKYISSHQIKDFINVLFGDL